MLTYADSLRVILQCAGKTSPLAKSPPSSSTAEQRDLAPIATTSASNVQALTLLVALYDQYGCNDAVANCGIREASLSITARCPVAGQLNAHHLHARRSDIQALHKPPLHRWYVARLRSATTPNSGY